MGVKKIKNMKEEIVEGNKLIAEFMNLYREDGQDFGGYYTEMWFDKTTHTRKVNGKLKYHTSWDWLMPVVEKIGKMYDNKELPIEVTNQFLFKLLIFADLKTTWNEVVNVIGVINYYKAQNINHERV